MKKLLETISLKTNLTKTEINTFSFITLVFLVGLVAKSIKINFETTPIKSFDYSYHDSLFKALKENSSNQLLSGNKKEKRVDSEVKLSDFSRLKLVSKKKTDYRLDNLKFDVNKADINQLLKIPGIGPKTAQKILALRDDRKKLKNIDELLEVKGIGNKKLDIIKNFIYIEK